MDDRDQPKPDDLDRQFTANAAPRQPSVARAVGPPGSISHVETAARADSSSPGLGQGVEGPQDASNVVDLSARYEIQDRLGGGGMGEVWRAKDRVLDRPVAIKRVKGNLAQSRQGVVRFLTEARAIAAVNHPNIVQVYDFGRDAQGYFLVMELVEGESLADRLHRCGPLAAAEAAELGASLCDGLAAAHDRGIVHRDIKPANILLTSSGVPKLGDFGVARLQHDESELTGTAAVLGTWDYMPLEQRTGAHQADARSDIWSLAATLYQAVTGQTPKIIHPDRIAAPLRAVLTKALEERPAERHQSAGEFGAALRATANVTPPPVASGVPGKCPSCGRVNGLERKFCGGCGNALKEPCLDCGEENGIWEQFCGKCGVNLDNRLNDEIARVECLREEALALRSGCRCGEAIALLEPLAAVRHARLAKRLAWVQDLLGQLRDEQQGLQANRERLYRAAQQAVAEHKYREAVAFLEEIPEPLRDDRVTQVLMTASAACEELKVLTAEINEATKRKRYRGLRPRVQRYLELRPNDERAKKLAAELRGMVAQRVIPPEPLDVVTSSIGMKLVLIPAGEFLMGSPGSDKLAVDYEKPQHRVRITKPFYLGVYPVTQAEYQQVMGKNPSQFTGDPNQPVEQVSWDDAKEFCRRLSALPGEKAAGGVYRLPTEAQWEYACRAGTTTRWCFGDDDGRLGEYAWFSGNSGNQTHPVGQKKANAWGLYDMHGNVWEWCEDWYGNYNATLVNDPRGAASGSDRVYRGGGWIYGAGSCRSAYRYDFGPGLRRSHLGFRISRVLADE